MPDLAAAIRQAEEALAQYERTSGTPAAMCGLNMMGAALRSLLAAAREAEGDLLFLHQYAFGLAHHPECQGEPNYLCCRCRAEKAEAALAEERRRREEAEKLAEIRYRLAYGTVDVVITKDDRGRMVEELLRITGDVPKGATNYLSLVEGLIRQRDKAREELLTARATAPPQPAPHPLEAPFASVWDNPEDAAYDTPQPAPLPPQRPMTTDESEAVAAVEEEMFAQPAPMPEAVREAEEIVSRAHDDLGNVVYTLETGEVLEAGYQTAEVRDRLNRWLIGIDDAKPAADVSRFSPSLTREVTKEAKAWLSAPYSNHGPQAIVDARGIMFRLLALIHEAPAPQPGMDWSGTTGTIHPAPQPAPAQEWIGSVVGYVAPYVPVTAAPPQPAPLPPQRPMTTDESEAVAAVEEEMFAQPAPMPEAVREAEEMLRTARLSNRLTCTTSYIRIEAERVLMTAVDHLLAALDAAKEPK